MAIGSSDFDGEPFVGLHALYDADFAVFGFEDWALFDVEFEVGG